MTLTCRVLRYTTMGLVLAAGLGCRQSRTPRLNAFVVPDAWVRYTPDTGATTAAYLILENELPYPVTVSGFQSDVARVVELHESMQDAHMMMHMTPKPSVRILSDSTIVMKPGGLHLMLIGTTRPLKMGELIRVVMRLSNGSIILTSARVRAS